MKILIQITLMTFLLFFSNCSKLDKKKHKQKETLLIATQNFNNIKEVKRTLTIFSDSTYTFIENLREPNHNKDETFEGPSCAKFATLSKIEKMIKQVSFGNIVIMMSNWAQSQETLRSWEIREILSFLKLSYIWVLDKIL